MSKIACPFCPDYVRLPDTVYRHMKAKHKEEYKKGRPGPKPDLLKAEKKKKEKAEADRNRYRAKKGLKTRSSTPNKEPGGKYEKAMIMFEVGATCIRAWSRSS